MVALQRAPDVLGVALAQEFRGVNPHDGHRLQVEALLEAREHWHHVEAVDTAVGPEIEQHDMTAQIFGQAQRLFSIEPSALGRKLGASHLADVGHGIVLVRGSKGGVARQANASLRAWPRGYSARA